jgi:predicted aldo/keto reductase-like oxidoreductase
MTIPTRPLGRTGVSVSAVGFGGHHLGDFETYEDAERTIHAGIDAGIRYFDNCWEYHNGKSEDWLGRALAGGLRTQVFLTTKVCTHGRDGSLALEMLEQSLRRLQTDHLDLWQIHGVTFDNDPDLAYRKGGVLEALDKAKRDGKVRFVGFTGHKDPAIHRRMIELGYPFDTCQMPLNCFDASFRSFEQQVLPLLQQRGIAALGMKPHGGRADAIKKGVVTAAEMLRYAMSLPVATTICGIDSDAILKQVVGLASSFTPMTPPEVDALRAKCRALAGDGRFELYKVSLVYDNPEARRAHQFPVDPKQKEIAEEEKQEMGSP